MATEPTPESSTREHPEEVQYRHCIWPTCPERFDYLAAYGGSSLTEARGWYRYDGLVALFICPVHYRSGHLPGRDFLTDTAPVTVRSKCSCGWVGERAGTLGAAKAGYVAHLAQVVEGAAPDG